jgi:D-alanyl-D-alanine dipeptidase
MRAVQPCFARVKGAPMKKILATVLTVLLALVLAASCGTPTPDGPTEKRSVELSQLYDGQTGQFSLDGHLPGTGRSVLEGAAGYLPDETVLFEGQPATVAYSYDQDSLTGAAFAFDTREMDASQWVETASRLYTLLDGALEGLAECTEGEPGNESGGTCSWYAGPPGGRAMLRFLSTPPTEETAGVLRVEIVSDYGDYQAVSDDYLAQFRPADETMVRVADWVPGIFVELKYATADNFIGQVIYDFTDAWLRFGTVEKLMRIQEALRSQGYSLKVYDAFRPVKAQFKLWEAVPDPVFVANPYKGYSTHSRGNTVDLTLVTLDGQPVEMPTPFDTFSDQADHDYSDVSEEAARNATLLENALLAEGFHTNPHEWWHYYDSISYPVAKDFDPGA